MRSAAALYCATTIEAMPCSGIFPRRWLGTFTVRQCHYRRLLRSSSQPHLSFIKAIMEQSDESICD
jgi:hypothetical protein